LDLSASTELRHLDIDDRPGVRGFAQPTLESARFTGNERRLEDLEPATGLFALTLEGNPTSSVDLRARLPQLRHLTVQTSPVESLEGLDAPNLERLHVSGPPSDHVLDLAPLDRLPNLRWVTVAGPRAVRNAHLLTGRRDLTLRIQAETAP
jgi:hypothetical protein